MFQIFKPARQRKDKVAKQRKIKPWKALKQSTTEMFETKYGQRLRTKKVLHFLIKTKFNPVAAVETMMPKATKKTTKTKAVSSNVKVTSTTLKTKATSTKPKATVTKVLD